MPLPSFNALIIGPHCILENLHSSASERGLGLQQCSYGKTLFMVQVTGEPCG